MKKPFNNPFEALGERRAEFPEGGAAKASEPPSGPVRAVVRMERKGRGGKEVTVVEQMGLGPAELERWCKELKKALGCGGTVEAGALVLQGDQRERVEALLRARGVKKISVG